MFYDNPRSETTVYLVFLEWLLIYSYSYAFNSAFWCLISARRLADGNVHCAGSATPLLRILTL